MIERRRPPLTLGAASRLLLAVAVLVLAAGVRFHSLEAQSLWNDEGNSLRLAQRPVADLFDAAGRDIHPPGYYLLLKGWIGPAGETEFALRALSALQGLLTVALAILLGRTLFGRGAGPLAGLMVALSASAVYYSQETRMYAQLALLAAASMALLARWLQRETSSPGPDSSKAGEEEKTVRGTLGYVLALAIVNAAGLYTHYSYAFTLLAQPIVVAVWLVASGVAAARRVALGYAAQGAVALLLFLPWLPTVWDQVAGWPRAASGGTLGEQLRLALAWITYGSTAGEVAGLRLLWPGLLALPALWPRHARQAGSGWRAGLPLLWGAAVVAGLFASGAFREANLKFLLPAQVAAALLMAGGAPRLWLWSAPGRPRRIGTLTARQTRYSARTLALVCLVVVGAGMAAALDALYSDPAHARDDYRGIAAAIEAQARPGDAIVLNAPNQAEVFTYYYDGSLPVYGLPRGLGGDDTQTRAEVAAVLSDHRRVFALFWGEGERDPQRVVQTTLDEGAYPVESAWWGDVRLATYAILDAPPAAPATTTDARFGAHLRLEGFAFSAEALRPGDVLGVTLYWSAAAPLAARYQVTAQLLAQDGTLISQHDAEPANYRAPTTSWSPGETVVDTHGLVIPPALASGSYQVIVAVYDPAAPLDRLPVTQAGAQPGDALPLGAVEVSN